MHSRVFKNRLSLFLGRPNSYGKLLTKKTTVLGLKSQPKASNLPRKACTGLKLITLNVAAAETKRYSRKLLRTDLSRGTVQKQIVRKPTQSVTVLQFPGTYKHCAAQPVRTQVTVEDSVPTAELKSVPKEQPPAPIVRRKSPHYTIKGWDTEDENFPLMI